jgi:hypothetical protein
VTKVDEKSPYAGMLAADTLIMQIDGEEVGDIAAARKLLTPGRHMLLVYRGVVRRLTIDVK